MYQQVPIQTRKVRTSLISKPRDTIQKQNRQVPYNFWNLYADLKHKNTNKQARYNVLEPMLILSTMSVTIFSQNITTILA